MKNVNIKILLKSFLFVLGIVGVSSILAFVLSSISQKTLLYILGGGALCLLWYIFYDILNNPNIKE